MRVIVNTVMALTASCIGSFSMSSIFHKGKFDMEDVLNATLAGGVIVGTTSDMITTAWPAILLGVIGGIISSIGFNKISSRLSVHDTCGVHNLHGIPGILGGLAGCIYAWYLDEEGVGSIFGARADGRSSWDQGWYQLAALVTVFVFAVISGFIAGYFASLFQSPSVYFHDNCNFEETGLDLELNNFF